MMGLSRTSTSAALAPRRARISVRSRSRIRLSAALFHPVESNVEEQRADRPALRSSLLGRGEPTFLDHARLEPVGDKSPGWERAELVQEVGVINAVERPRQIR